MCVRSTCKTQKQEIQNTYMIDGFSSAEGIPRNNTGDSLLSSLNSESSSLRVCVPKSHTVKWSHASILPMIESLWKVVSSTPQSRLFANKRQSTVIGSRHSNSLVDSTILPYPASPHLITSLVKNKVTMARLRLYSLTGSPWGWHPESRVGGALSNKTSLSMSRFLF